MREIKLTQGKIALVDDIDYEWLIQSKWYARKQPNSYDKWYATRRIKKGEIVSAAGLKKQYIANNCVPMHRVIMNASNGLEVDHINHNGLDNRRNNLRLCTSSENLRNSRKRRNTTSKYKGVHFDKRSGKWRLAFQISFDSEELAGRAYDKVVNTFYGKFANRNFKLNGDMCRGSED